MSSYINSFTDEQVFICEKLPCSITKLLKKIVESIQKSSLNMEENIPLWIQTLKGFLVLSENRQ